MVWNRHAKLPPAPRATPNPSVLRWGLWLAALSGIIVLISSAWLSEDAYITLRTIDNVWNGYGLRWNAMQRVQAYTHPLWMMLIAAAYGLTRETFLTTLALSFACTIGAAAIVVTRIAPVVHCQPVRADASRPARADRADAPPRRHPRPSRRRRGETRHGDYRPRASRWTAAVRRLGAESRPRTLAEWDKIALCPATTGGWRCPR
jgi:hypothetical protein